jgi:hypothetical protein
MELKKLEEQWNNFPEMSLEERPVLSTDLEKMSLNNPFTQDFYLRNRLLIRIYASIILWIFAANQLKGSWRQDEGDLYEQILGLSLLSYFIYFHIRLLLFSDYSSLGTLPLIPFLSKIEIILDKYMHAYRIISPLAGVYLLALLEKAISFFHGAAASSFGQNSIYKWLIILFLSVSFYILFLNTTILKTKKLLTAVRSYREGIILANAQNPR